MNIDGEIVIIEDDIDDQELFAAAFRNLNISNPIIFFNDAEFALVHLERDGIHPFLIISDINMPKVDGFELRARIYVNSELSKICTPYIFFATSLSKEAVLNAYAYSVQGFFQKPTTFEELESTLRSIIDYWKKCYTPNRFCQPGSQPTV